MKKRLTFCSLFLIFSSFAVLKYNDFSTLITKTLQDYSTNKWPEKVYIQTDKSNYFTTDTIWFSAYLVNGITHLKSTKSKVLYTELINDTDSVIKKRQLYINAISTHGDFSIDKNLQEGKYRLRAYTNYMQNESPDFFFEKQISIWNKDNDRGSPNTLDQITKSKEDFTFNKPILNFYPEGGDLVENITSKIAVKLENEAYKTTPITVKIEDDMGTLITEFKTLNYGLGLFYLKPLPYKTYYASIELNGKLYKYQIPKALPIGYGLGVNQKDNQLLVNIESTEPQGLKNAYLIIHQRGDILYSKLETTNKKAHLINLSTQNLRDGVAHITVFNSDANPVAERLVYIQNPKNDILLNIEADKTSLLKKEKITLKLNIENDDGYSIPSTFSVSVKHLNTADKNDYSETIKSWLLLNSDLKGEILDAGYFFGNKTDSKKSYLLDLTMMTHGWRRFTWQNLLYDQNTTNSFTVEKGISISGTTNLLKATDKTTASFTSLTFLSDQLSGSYTQRTNGSGKFNYGPFIFYDSIPTLIQARLTNINENSDNDRAIKILLDSVKMSPKLSKRANTTTIKVETNEAATISKITKYISDVKYQYNSNSQKLEEVLIIGNKNIEKEERQKEMIERSKFDDPSYRLDIETDETLSKQTALNLLTRFPGVVFTGKNFFIRGVNVRPRILLDDMDVELEEIARLPATQISFVDYYRGTNAAIFSNSAGGVFTIYTRREKRRSIDRKTGIINFNTKGFYTAKEFYSPKYTSEAKRTEKADIRTTLYWNPKVEITKQYKTQNLSFFTSDIKGDYIIEIEGMTITGIPLYNSVRFTVE